MQFALAEHYIQYQKALLFGDSVMTNKILKCGMPLEAKKLSYNISGFNRTKWVSEGYEICVKGIREKQIADGNVKRHRYQNLGRSK